MAINPTPRGYRVPDGNEPPAIDVHVGHLAADVDADVSELEGALTTVSGDLDVVEQKVADTGSLADGAVPTDPILAWGANWSQYTAAPWSSGVRVRRWGPLVIVSGAVQKSAAWAANELVLTLAVGFRPEHQVDNRAFAVTPAGQVSIDAASATATAVPIHLVFFRP